jgi:kumamolisin
MRTHIAAALLLLIATTADAQPQAPTRPPSDSAAAPAGQVGTNYLRSRKETTGNPVPLVQALQKPKAALAPPTHLVAPTSDRQNRSVANREAGLLAAIQPANVSPSTIQNYTNYRTVRPNVGVQHYNVGVPTGTPPAKIRKVYGVNADGAGVIAIVDAFHYPNAAADLAKFSKAFNIPLLPPCPKDQSVGSAPPCLKIEAAAAAPIDCGWNGEAALDLQWAHAIAPKARLLFVEAPSSNSDDMYAAVARARDEIAAQHGQLSMSWGASAEFEQLTGFASTFTDGVLYFAATGDTGGQVSFPATFPNVIAVGGTVLHWAADDSFAESGWPDGGGGVSKLEKLPSFQTGVENVDPAGRNIPDIAAVSDANPAVPVYVSTPSAQCHDQPAPDQYMPGWTQLVGTSLATPVMAAIVNVAAHDRPLAVEELRKLYANRSQPLRVRDIVAMEGSAGGNVAKTGFDNVTGVGTAASLEFDAD